MRILIDGDACPNKNEIKDLAIKYQKEMLVFVDYAHILQDDYYRVVECEIGHDSVDMKMVKEVQNGDLVITQDYGLASLVLLRGAEVLHITGKIIDQGNIDSLLMSRFVSAKQRRANKHLKGPSKRTEEIETQFLESLEIILKNHIV